MGDVVLRSLNTEHGNTAKKAKPRAQYTNTYYSFILIIRHTTTTSYNNNPITSISSIDHGICDILILHSSSIDSCITITIIMPETKHIPRFLDEMKKACRRPLYSDIVLQTSQWKGIHSSIKQEITTNSKTSSIPLNSETASQVSSSQRTGPTDDKQQEKSWQQVCTFLFHS